MADNGFKTSLLGFNREDVLAMMDSISAQNTQEQNQARELTAQLQQRLTEVTKRYNDLLARARAINEELGREQQNSLRLQQKLDDLEDKYVYAQEVIDTLKVEWEKRQKEYDALVAEKAAFDNTHAGLRAENAELKEQVEALTRQVAEVNQKRSDIELENNRMRMEASVEAHRILEDANTQARRMLDEANARIAQSQEQANREAIKFRDSLVGNAKDLVVRMAVLKQRVHTVDQALSQAASGLEHWCDPINQALDAAQADVSRLGNGMLQVSREAMEEATQIAAAVEPPAAEPPAAPPPPPVPVMNDALESLMLEIDRMGGEAR